jgi:hypothetical protein
MPDVILKHVPGMASAMPVAVRNAAELSEAVFKADYVARSCPCVIKGAVAHWPATRKWRDRDYLKSICGTHEVIFLAHENHLTSKRTVPGQASLPYAQAIDRLYEAKVGAIACNTGTAEMEADIKGFSFFTQAQPAFNYEPLRYFFFHNAGSSWHYHPFDETLMNQVIGTKRVGLLKVESPHHHAVRRIFFHEDYYEDPSVFAEIRDADLQWFSADLDEGDALYIPPLWWHGVIATSAGVGVTAPVSWRSPPHVVADALRKMGAGHFDLMGPFTLERLQAIRDAARAMGLERELDIAWQRASAARLVSVWT